MAGGSASEPSRAADAAAARLRGGLARAHAHRSRRAAARQVFPTNLDRAFKLARLEPMTSGLRDQNTNRELTMVWQFMPHAAEQQRAALLLAKTAKGLRPPSVPAYIVDGLVLSKRGKDIRPVFLSKKDCDAALAKLGDDGKGAKIRVVDALSVLVALSNDIEEGMPAVEEELKSFELVPPSESLEFKTFLKRDKPNRPAKVWPPGYY